MRMKGTRFPLLSSEAERALLIESLLRRRGQVQMSDLMSVAKCSRASVKRTLSFMREDCGIWVLFDGYLQAYRLEPNAPSFSAVVLAHVEMKLEAACQP